MSPTTEAGLTPRQRLTRGLTYTAVGPVDLTRGVVGLGVNSARAGASDLRRRYREGRLARELAAAQEALTEELGAVQEVVTGLPQALQEARRSRGRSRRPWVIGAVAASVFAGGTLAFVIIRHSMHRDDPVSPGPRPPSVDVQPKP